MVYLPGINYIRCFAMQMYKELINKQTFVNKIRKISNITVEKPFKMSFSGCI